MRIELEPSDIDQIAQRVVELIEPMLSGGQDQTQRIMDKKALSEYLKVDVTWIDKNLYMLPHFKAGKYVRFKKLNIDNWIRGIEKLPSFHLRLLEGRK
jgi:hypothetical protein